jgi:hypothetical protein
MKNFNLIFFTNDKFRHREEYLIKRYSKYFKNIFNIRYENLLDTELNIKFNNIFSQEKGCGFWIWKPYILLDMIRKHPNEKFIYIDAGDNIKEERIQLFDTILGDNSLCLAENFHKHVEYTKRDCFHYMDCDEVKYWAEFQIEAGTILFKCDELSEKIFTEWYNWCKDERILTNLENQGGKPNYKFFIEHRWDQSILTNIQIKYKLPKSTELTNSIEYNV